MLLPPLLGGAAVLCLLLAVALSFHQRRDDNPLAAYVTPEALTTQLAVHLEGTPTPADIQRAQKPLGERRRLLHAHPYFSLYKIAKRRFDVSWYLVAAVHYQDTGFGEARERMAQIASWRRFKDSADGILRPGTYPNRTIRHPHVKDDFDYVMSIAAGLKQHGARHSLMQTAERAVSARYGETAAGRLATAMVLERAKAWRLLGAIPLPGSGELATPAKGVIGGCGYFGCPRPGHLHNGVDFLAPTGTPIHAAEGGLVAVVESPGQSSGYGNFACIQHRPHLATCYAHLSAFATGLGTGSRVARGQVIGLVGSTGRSTAPHLHFEVRAGDAECSACAIDPLPLLSGDVPDAALPQMTATAPSPKHVAPVAVAGATRPVVAPPAAADDGEQPPAAETRGRTPARPAEPTSGGSAPAPAPPAQKAPAPGAPQPPATQAPSQAPAPPPPAPDTATGGAVAAPAAPPPPPDPPADPAPPPTAPG